jgi:dephospho-CoA kinase
MIKVGVTGGIGSGKSIVCRVFESLGIPVYYADNHSRRLVDSEPDIRKKLVDLFGPDIYTGGTLNRPRFAAVIFADPKLLEAANDIIHPYVREDFDRWSRSYTEKKYIIEEAAILFESGENTLVDKSITIVSPVEMRMKRILKRPGMTPGRIRDIMANQWPDEKKADFADFVIVNDEKSLILPQILFIHHQLTT